MHHARFDIYCISYVNKLLEIFYLDDTTLCGGNQFLVIKTEAAYMKHKHRYVACQTKSFKPLLNIV